MSKKTIMIIEDDAFVMDIYQTKLTMEGFDTIAVHNGMEALRKLDDPKFMPDLILLDIVMPYVDGMEVLKKIKEDEKLKKIPTILLTNLSQKEDVEQGLGLGADDYLIKSHFTPSEVLKKIKIYI